MFYYCLSHSSGGAFEAQLGLDEVLFVQKVCIMSTVRVYERCLNQAENEMCKDIVYKSQTFPSYGSFMSHERLLAAVYLSFCSRRANEIFGP